jgi:hypothetical protein
MDTKPRKTLTTLTGVNSPAKFRTMIHIKESDIQTVLPQLKEIAVFSEYAQSLNGTGINWTENEKEYRCDVFLFVEESEEDNTYMRGGFKSFFGHVYGFRAHSLNTFTGLSSFKKQDDKYYERALIRDEKQVKTTSEKLVSLSVGERIKFKPHLFMKVINSLLVKGMIARLDQTSAQAHHIRQSDGRVAELAELVMNEENAWYSHVKAIN